MKLKTATVLVVTTVLSVGASADASSKTATIIPASQEMRVTGGRTVCGMDDEEYLRAKAYLVIRECARFFRNHCIYDMPDGSSFVCKCTDLERLKSGRERPFMTTCGAIDTLRTAEGNCLYAINSMLHMEADGECRIGAGVPKEWKDWSFRLPAESGYEVDFAMKGGAVTKLVLRQQAFNNKECPILVALKSSSPSHGGGSIG